MQTRARADIERDIAELKAKLRALSAEKRALPLVRNAPIIADFDDGMDIAEIAKSRGFSYALVQGVLNRAGRTQSGRIAIRAQLQVVGDHDARTVST